MTAMGRFGKSLVSTGASRFWLAVFCAGVVALCAIGVYKLAFNSDPMVNLDAAGLDEVTESEVIPNKVNTSQLPDSSFIYDVSIEELAKADSYMDGQTVQVTGEVVGDCIIAEDDPASCWITLQSTDKTDFELSVYMPLATAESMIDTYGRYGKRGTQLQVRGTFNLACVDHQGTSELRSENVAVVSKGTAEAAEFAASSMVPGILLIMLGSAMMLLFDYLRERQR